MYGDRGRAKPRRPTFLGDLCKTGSLRIASGVRQSRRQASSREAAQDQIRFSVFRTRRREVRSRCERTHHRGGTQFAVAIKHAGELTLLQSPRASARETPGAGRLSTPRQFGLCTNRAFQSRRNPSGAVRRRNPREDTIKPGHEVPAAMDGGSLDSRGCHGWHRGPRDSKRRATLNDE